MTYDLTVRGVGTFAVFVATARARVVRLVAPPAAQRGARSTSPAEPLVLAELLAGERDKVRRFRRAGEGLRPAQARSRALAPLPRRRALARRRGDRRARGSSPALVYRALPLAIAPEWTRGHSFTVAQQIVELAPHAWHITRPRRPCRCGSSSARADAPRRRDGDDEPAAFERHAARRAAAAGDRPQIRGDRDAVAALKRWTDLARR